MKKPPHLTTTFYRNFVVLIVVPLLVIILVALGILRNLMRETAYDTIDVSQQNVVDTLRGEIKNNSLKLTHFLLTNEREVLELADNIVLSEGRQKYFYTTRLQELYNFMVTPSTDIIAIHFYTKDGQVISLKDDLALPLEEVRTYDFYQNALAYPEHTQFGLINSGFTFKTQLTEPARTAIAVSFAPSGQSQIEMVCWYTHTAASRIITDYQKEENQGEMYLVDSAGDVLIRPRVKQPRYQLPENLGSYYAGRHNYTSEKHALTLSVAPVPGTAWRVVHLMQDKLMLASFNRTTAVVLLASLIIFGLFFAYSVIFLRGIIAPVNTLVLGMTQVRNGNLNTRIEPTGQEEIRILMESFNSMINQTQELMSTNEAQQKEKMQVEIQALQSQINPHFLVNTLNSIRFTAMVSKFDNIKNMAEALIKILTASFKDPGTIYSIRDELEMLESYSYLMKIRYSENFDVEWQVPSELLEYGIPRLLIQPLVENAITHGFEDREDPGRKTISLHSQDGNIYIAVSDDGQGIEPERAEAVLAGRIAEPKNGHGIGLANVNRRVKLNYGEQYGLLIDSAPGKGSRFTIVIPALKPQGENHA